MVISAEGYLYVAGSDQHFYSLRSDGTVRWALAMASYASAGAIGADGTVYTSDSKGLHAITSEGCERWLFPSPDGLFGFPTIGHDGTVYVVGGNNVNRLYAVDAAGLKKWSLLAPFGGLGSPAVGVNALYADNDGVLLAIDLSGKLMWTFGGDVRTPAAIGSDGTVYVGSGSGIGVVQALTPAGIQKWSLKMGSNNGSMPAIRSDGSVIVGGYDKLYAVTPDGALVWAVDKADVNGQSPIVGADGTVYIGLSAFAPDGSKKWTLPVAGVGSSGAIGADGTVYMVAGGKLYAVGP